MTRIPALVSALVLATTAGSFAAPDQPQESKLIAVLKSDARQKEKADACRGLGQVGTKECVPVLTGLLADEQLSHMARYALEMIPDSAVEEALRSALPSLKGRPLVGVIGSLGVRRDAKAVHALAELLKSDDPDVVQAAERALGSIGTPSAAKALQKAQDNAPASAQLALCEGLCRAAERLAADREPKPAVDIYDQLRGLKDAPHQVRTAAVRGAILARQKDGLALLKEYLHNQDYLLFAAACRASLEMPGPDVTRALAAALGGLPSDNQILLIQTLARRKDKATVPALSAVAKKGEDSVRIAAIRALAEVGHKSAVPVLTQLAKDSNPALSKAAQESLASFQPSTQPTPQS